MAQKELDREALQQAVDAVEKHGTQINAAKALGISYETFRHRVRKARENGFTVSNGTIIKAQEKETSELWAEVEFWRKRCHKLERDSSSVQRIRREIFGLKEASFEPPKWSAKSGRKRHPDVPILFTSDFQYGEVVRPAEINGLNAYDNDIAQRRYKDLITSTIDIAFNYRNQSQYEGIYYLRGGDAISGDIHEELKETNEVSSMVQVKEVAELEAWGIEKLAEAFGKVHIISVPGNHGRSTKKPRSKQYVETNYEYLIALLLEWHFQRDKRLTFQNPLSGEQLFQIYNTKFLLMHGDMIGSRGGQGFIGPAATIMRGLKKTRDQYADMQQMFDWLLIGHWHVPMILPHCVVNGALVGPSEYSIKSLRAQPEPAAQTLMFVNPKWGMYEPRTILLENPGTTW